MRASPAASPESAAMLALRVLARRYQALSGELTALEAELDRLARAAAPQLVAQFEVGTDTAGALLVAAGDNPGRLRLEAVRLDRRVGWCGPDHGRPRRRRRRLQRCYAAGSRTTCTMGVRLVWCRSKRGQLELPARS